MTMRYFRAAESVYIGVLDGINAAWGLPADGQIAAFAPAESAPRDSQGRLYLAVWDFFCNYDAVAAVLPALLASGAIEEITSAEYHSAADGV